jgi:hypothetical protein
VVKFHIAEDIFEKGVIDPVKIDLVARMSGNFYSRACMGVFEVEKPIGKKCIGYDQIPEHIRESQIYSANDLGKFGNSESYPDEESVKNFIDKVKEEKLDNFEISHEAFLRYQRLNDHKKMLKAALELEEDKNKNIELAAKCALQNNDMNLAWNAALFVRMI